MIKKTDVPNQETDVSSILHIFNPNYNGMRLSICKCNNNYMSNKTDVSNQETKISSIIHIINPHHNGMLLSYFPVTTKSF